MHTLWGDGKLRYIDTCNVYVLLVDVQNIVGLIVCIHYGVMVKYYMNHNVHVMWGDVLNTVGLTVCIS